MIVGLEPISAIYHWLNTPIGSYCGFPLYGFNGNELLYKNSHDAESSIDKIYSKMREDLGEDIMQTVAEIKIVTVDDAYLLLVSLKNKTLTGVEL